jgi:hypothetical protein
VNNKFTVHARAHQIATSPTTNPPRRLGNALVQTVLSLGAILVTLAPASPVSAQRDNNCDDFETHAAAVLWFEEQGGSLEFNAGGLDGDRDGVPCEDLIRSGPIERTLDTVSGGHPVAGVIVMTLLVVAAAGGLLLWRWRSRRLSARNPHLPLEPKDSEQVYWPYVPQLREIETTGILNLRIVTNTGQSLPDSLTVHINGEDTTMTIAPGSAVYQHTVELPIGEYVVQVRSIDRLFTGFSRAFVVKDDVTRQTIELGPDIASSPEIA